MRAVTPADAPLLLAWRNDPESRNASRNTAPVTAAEHEAWLTRMLASPNEHVMRIAELSGKPVGMVRADRIADGWELSWNVGPGARRQGIGGRMLKTFVDGMDGRVTAVIRTGNEASAKIAARAGLARVDEIDRGRFELWVRGERQR